MFYSANKIFNMNKCDICFKISEKVIRGTNLFLPFSLEIFSLNRNPELAIFLNQALISRGKKEGFTEANKSYIIDTVCKLLTINQDFEIVCFGCFVRNLKSVILETERENILNYYSRYDDGDGGSASTSSITNFLQLQDDAIQENNKKLTDLEKDNQDLKDSNSDLQKLSSHLLQKNKNVENNVSSLERNFSFKISSLETKNNKLVAWTKEKFWEDAKKLSEQELKRYKDDYLSENYQWYKPLTGEQKEKIQEAKNEMQLNQIVGDIKKVHNKIKEGLEKNIFHFNTPQHIIGWILFIPLFSVGVYYANKERKKERKITNHLEDIDDKFKKWRLNMVLSLAFYVLFFIGVKQFINRFVRSQIDQLLENWAFVTVGAVSALLGILFVIDGFITSSLKTPLQRLGVKIENAPIDEKTKGKLLSKTQKANEVLKENFKRFGLLALPAIITGLLGKKWDEQTIAYLCYLIPVFYASFDICQVGKAIKKVKKRRRR